MAKATVLETATKPFYAYVGASDYAVELVRKAAADVQSQLDDARKKGVVTYGRSEVTDRIDALAKEAKTRQLKAETLLKDLQADARALPKRAEARYASLQADAQKLPKQAEARFTELQAQLNGLPKRVEALVKDLQADR